jgi:uroporphyrinogen-III synthase
MAQEYGLATIIAPMFEIVPLDWTPPEPEQFDAILLTSSNALLHGGEGLNKYLHLPAFAVGEQTAMAARNTGFQITATGNGGIDILLPSISSTNTKKLLWLHGLHHSKFMTPDHISVTGLAVYENRAHPLPAMLSTNTMDGIAILLHSARAAKHFATEADAAGLIRNNIILCAISKKVALAAGMGWRKVIIANQPDDVHMLSSIAAWTKMITNT